MEQSTDTTEVIIGATETLVLEVARPLTIKQLILNNFDTVSDTVSVLVRKAGVVTSNVHYFFSNVRINPGNPLSELMEYPLVPGDEVRAISISGNKVSIHLSHFTN